VGGAGLSVDLCWFAERAASPPEIDTPDRSTDPRHSGPMARSAFLVMCSLALAHGFSMSAQPHRFATAGRNAAVSSVNMAMERTYIMIKPDGVQRGLVGEIIKRFEQRGYELKALKLYQASDELLRQHYCDLVDKKFFPGENAVKMGRQMLGATNPQESMPGTIRGDYSIVVGRNICHGSDSAENAEKEIALWFDEDEICKWESHSTEWINEEN
jgi:nucleoside-diphosphate kinase